MRWQCLQSTAFIREKIVGKEKRLYTHAQDVRMRERAHTYALIICRRVEIREISVMYSLQSVLHVIGVDQSFPQSLFQSESTYQFSFILKLELRTICHHLHDILATYAKSKKKFKRCKRLS